MRQCLNAAGHTFAGFLMVPETADVRPWLARRKGSSKWWDIHPRWLQAQIFPKIAACDFRFPYNFRFKYFDMNTQFCLAHVGRPGESVL